MFLNINHYLSFFSYILFNSQQGLDQLRSGLLQQPKSFMPGPQPPFHQLQMLTPQHQQQLMLAQQSLTSPSANDVESRRLRMLLNNRSMSMGKDGLTNSVGDVVPNIGSPLQAGCPVLPRADPEMLMKVPFDSSFSGLIFHCFVSWDYFTVFFGLLMRFWFNLFDSWRLHKCSNSSSNNSRTITNLYSSSFRSILSLVSSLRVLITISNKIKSWVLAVLLVMVACRILSGETSRYIIFHSVPDLLLE